MIKILYVIGGTMHRAGAETMIMGYFRKLDRSRFSVDFAVHGDAEGAFDSEIRALGGRIFHLPPRKQLLSNIRTLERLIRENGYDIVHAHADVASGLAMYAAYRCGVPIRIAHSHNTQYQTRNPLQLQLHRIFKKMLQIYANVNVACSELAGEFLFDGAPYRVIRNAVDLDRFGFDPEIRSQVREELGCGSEDKVILHVARFNFQKNHSRLLRIFQAAHRMDGHLKLFLVGEGELLDQTRQLCRELGLEKSVRFLGVRQDVERLYQAADLFVMPSLFEGLPVTGVEAQAAGLPCLFSDVITAEVGFLPETAYCSLDADDTLWAQTITGILAAGTDRSAGKALVAEKGYDLSAEAGKLMALYESLYRERKL